MADIDVSGAAVVLRPKSAADQTADANAETLRTRAMAAMNANATYLALASPTGAQTTAQVQALTKECSALIRLMMGVLDTTAGT